MPRTSQSCNISAFLENLWVAWPEFNCLHDKVTRGDRCLYSNALYYKFSVRSLNHLLAAAAAVTLDNNLSRIVLYTCFITSPRLRWQKHLIGSPCTDEVRPSFWIWQMTDPQHALQQQGMLGIPMGWVWQKFDSRIPRGRSIAAKCGVQNKGWFERSYV